MPQKSALNILGQHETYEEALRQLLKDRKLLATSGVGSWRAPGICCGDRSTDYYRPCKAERKKKDSALEVAVKHPELTWLTAEKLILIAFD